VAKKKPSLGRDPFSTTNKPQSGAVRKMLDDNTSKQADTKQIDVAIKLTPSSLKHLDGLIVELEKAGKGRYTRNELIRVAITLLSEGDF